MLAALLVAGAAGAFAAECAPGTVDLRGPWGQAAFSVELALTPEERNLGLMNRDHLGRASGMLFVFDPPRAVSFWMRNTLIPLDMIFVDKDGVVTRLHENAVPLDETAIPGGDRVFAVLEINGGLASQYGIAPGTELRHPVFGTGAAWPCTD